MAALQAHALGRKRQRIVTNGWRGVAVYLLVSLAWQQVRGHALHDARSLAHASTAGGTGGSQQDRALGQAGSNRRLQQITWDLVDPVILTPAPQQPVSQWPFFWQPPPPLPTAPVPPLAPPPPVKPPVQTPASPPPASPPAQQQTGAANSVWVSLSLDVRGRTIPQQYLGISHEWPNVEELATPGFMQMYGKLSSYGSGPLVLRVGGGSTEKQTTVPSTAVWAALSKLHEQLGVQLILGLNFEKGDVQLAQAQMQAAQRNLPSSSILTFEIGNEPNFYSNKSGLPASQYVACCYVAEWGQFGRTLSCPAVNGTVGTNCTNNQFAGPAWGHVYMFPSTMAWFIRQNRPWLKMTTLHWYKDTASTPNTAVTLLDEQPLRNAMTNLRKVVAESNKQGLPLRVAESNTISDSGRAGVSDVFAAALWAIDACFESAAAGSMGINFHQGAGQNLYSAMVRTYPNGWNAETVPRVRPIYYGHLLFQMAVGGGSRFVPKQVTSTNSKVKVWPVIDNTNATLRVVILNKLPDQPANVTISANLWGNYGRGTLIRLTAQGGLDEKAFIFLAGQTYGGAGLRLRGTQANENVSRTAPSPGALGVWNVYMPPASAALLTVPQEASG